MDNTVAANLSVRARLAEHRSNAACASCHNLMDPIGLSLEQYDAIGRWRTLEDGLPIDATGGLPDGSKFAFNMFEEDGVHIYVMNVDGTGLTQVTMGGVQDGHLSWVE